MHLQKIIWTLVQVPSLEDTPEKTTQIVQAAIERVMETMVITLRRTEL